MSLFAWLKKDKKFEIDKENLPKHIAIIMDGNGRWAAKRGLPRAAGHRAGVESLKKIVKCCGDIGIEYLTLYAFSTENWKRPKEEVNALMSLMVEYIHKEITRLKEAGVRINPIGDISQMSPLVRKNLEYAIAETKENNKLILNVALNYGGRDEIARAVKKIASEVSLGNLKLEDIDEKQIESFLYTKNQPDPDLLIRTSGEMRLSNFLLWQIAYSEIWITDVKWPDFSPDIFLKAIADYQGRSRRFGGLK